MFKKIIAGAVLAVASVAAFPSFDGVAVINNSNETVIFVEVVPDEISAPVFGREPNKPPSNLLFGFEYKIDPNTFMQLPSNFQRLVVDKCFMNMIAYGKHGSRWAERINVCKTNNWIITGGRKF